MTSFLRTAIIYTVIVAVVMTAAAIFFNVLGPPGHLGMYCWESSEHGGQVVCATQPPAGVTEQAL